jgi:hypothetical protein
MKANRFADIFFWHWGLVCDFSTAVVPIVCSSNKNWRNWLGHWSSNASFSLLTWILGHKKAIHHLVCSDAGKQRILLNQLHSWCIVINSSSEEGAHTWGRYWTSCLQKIFSLRDQGLNFSPGNAQNVQNIYNHQQIVFPHCCKYLPLSPSPMHMKEKELVTQHKRKSIITEKLKCGMEFPQKV